MFAITALPPLGTLVVPDPPGFAPAMSGLQPQRRRENISKYEAKLSWMGSGGVDPVLGCVRIFAVSFGASPLVTFSFHVEAG